MNFRARRTLCATRGMTAGCPGRTGNGAGGGGFKSRGGPEPRWCDAGGRPRGRAALVPQAQPGRLVRLERPHRGQGRGAGSRAQAFGRHLHHHRHLARRLPGILQRLRQPDAVADPALPARPRGVLQPRHGGLSPRQRDVRRPFAGLPQARRRDLGARLSFPAARQGAARARRREQDRLLPAYSVSAAGPADRAAQARAHHPEPLPLRSGRIPDRQRRRQSGGLSHRRMPDAEPRPPHLHRRHPHDADRRVSGRRRDGGVRASGAPHQRRRRRCARWSRAWPIAA